MLRWPIWCHALENASCGASLWRQRGQLHIAIAVKRVFRMVPDGPMAPVEAVPLRALDTHHDDSPARSVRQATELCPYRPRVDVTAVGHAHAPGGSVPAMSVRLAMYHAERVVLDKAVHVFGERAVQAPGQLGDAAPFDRMELCYERALRADANPHGVHPSQVAPNLIHTQDAGAPGGFGPVSRYAQSRRALLDGVERKALEAKVAELPDDFDGRYFQVAPVDQQIAQIVGDEWLVLDGWSAGVAGVSSQLPRARAEAFVVALTAGAAEVLGKPAHAYNRVKLAADSLHVDADVMRVSVVWRGSVEVARHEHLDGLHAVGGVALGDEVLSWPDPRGLQVRAAGAQEPSRAPARPLRDAAQPTPVGSGVASPGVPAASPWAAVIKPIPQQIGSGVVTYADPNGSTVTLTREQRERARSIATPFAMAQPNAERFDAPPGAPFAREGTHGMSAGDVERAIEQADRAPFRMAAPGEGGRLEAPEGAPFAERQARPVPLPAGKETPGLSGTPEATAYEVAASRFFHQLPRAERGDDAGPDMEAPPAIPKRESDTIPVVCSEGVWLVSSPWQHRPPRDSLTVLVKATYDIVPGGPVTRRKEADLPTGDVHYDDNPARSLQYPSDMALFKPRADVVLLGHAYAPKGRGVATQVRFRFGQADKPRFDRRVAIFGDRRYQRALVLLAPTKPEPFSRIPLVYELAFGGPGYKANPVGLGLSGLAGAEGVARLPNLEDPDDLIKGPESKPRPACFGPIAPAWSQRWRHTGSCSARWLSQRWPYFPDDFDWAHYQCAPREQQTDYLMGDEPFLITGAHEQHTHIEGRLAGERPRCFMVTAGVDAPGAEHAFEEVKLRLDTAVFDMDAMTVNLVWRGIVEVSGELAPEIETFFLMVDPEGVRTSHEQAHTRLLAEAYPRSPVAASAEGEPAPANDVGKEETPGPYAAVLQSVQEQQAEIQEKLRAKGIDVDVEPPELPPLDPAQIAKTLREAGTSEADVAAVLDALAKRDDDREEAEPSQLEPTPRQRAEALIASGDAFDGVDLSDGDLHGLDFTGRSMRGCRLARANLAGATLAGADLTAADLVATTLSGAVLDGAALDGADLSQADAEGASMRAVHGERCLLTGGSWTSACFASAVLPRLDLTDARFDHAVFDHADLTRAHLFDSRGERASFKGAKLQDALCNGLILTGANLFRVRGDRSSWEKACLDDATLLECRFDDANFIRASLMRADASATSFVEARMSRMNATAAKFVKSNLMAAIMKAAVLRDADFTSANLYSCEVWKADLRGVNLNEAITTMSKLSG